MKRKLLLTLAILLLAGLLSACASADTFGSSSWPGIVASEDTVYMAYGTQVYAINLQSGVELWHYPEKGSNSVNFYAAPVLTEDGQLLVTGYDNNLYSLDPNKGAENWIFEGAGNRYVASPLVAGEMIFAASADGFLYALDMAGNLLWSFETEQPIWANPVTDPACGCVYVASMDHHVYAIKTSSGAQIWRSEDLGGAIVGTPAYADGTLYVGTFDKEVIALDASDGSVLWRFTAKNWVWASPAIATPDLLLAGDLDGYLYAINPKSGLELWSILQDGPIASTPLITADRIYYTTQTKTIYAADLQGTIVWKQIVDGNLYGSPLAAGELILVAPIKGDYLLVALNSEGAQKWYFAPAK